MARTSPQTTFRIPDPPPDLKISPVPDKEGPEEAAQWIRDELGIKKATARWIHEKTIKHEIRYHLLFGRRYYSTRDLYNFIMTQVKRHDDREIA